MQHYYELIHLIERLHRQSLDLLQLELDRMGLKVINAVQSLILYNIGTESLTCGELTRRGYYLGSNVSYNLNKLIQHGYVLREPSPHDRRSYRVGLSMKGLALHRELDQVFRRHANQLGRSGLSNAELHQLGETLRKLQHFWSLQNDPGARPPARAQAPLPASHAGSPPFAAAGGETEAELDEAVPAG
jgi:DNA-binding MarR family transcriptional regulator